MRDHRTPAYPLTSDERREVVMRLRNGEYHNPQRLAGEWRLPPSEAVELFRQHAPKHKARTLLR